MSKKTSDNSTQPGRMLLPSLSFSRFAAGIPGIISSLLLIEIGTTFGSSIGITGQISTASSVLRIATALIMGVLSVRYNHKTLLLAGLGLYLISAIGCSFAVNFNMLIIFFMLSGPALAFVNPMTSTIVGEYFPREKRTSALGWLITGMSTSYVIGAQIISRIAGFGGWRLTFLGFMIPVSIIGIVLIAIFVPGGKNTQNEKEHGGSSLAFKAVLFQRSAFSCLLGNVFRGSVLTVIAVYSISFMRQQFSISRSFSSIVLTSIALTFTVGNLLAGRFVKMYGRKSVTSVSVFLAASFTLVFFLSSNMWFAFVLVMVGNFFGGMSASAGQSLNLEQVSEFRGTMMSISTAFNAIGSTLGSGLGGYLLLVFNWGTLGIVFGLFGIIGALIVYFFASDQIMKNN
jgi:predicted MFS family arabinose efflux permease